MAFGLKNTVVLAERRRAQRESVDVAATARTSSGERIPFVIEVLSVRGFLARSPQALPKGAYLDVTFPSGRASPARVVWLEEGKIGCEFISPVELHRLLKSTEVARRSFVERRGSRVHHRTLESDLSSAADIVDAGLAGAAVGTVRNDDQSLDLPSSLEIKPCDIAADPILRHDVASRADALVENYGIGAVNEGIVRAKHCFDGEDVTDGQIWISAVFELVRRDKSAGRPL